MFAVLCLYEPKDFELARHMFDKNSTVWVNVSHLDLLLVAPSKRGLWRYPKLGIPASSELRISQENAIFLFEFMVYSLEWNRTGMSVFLYAPCMANGFLSDTWDIFVHESSISLDLGASSSSSSSSFYFPVFPPCSTPRDSTCFFSGLQGPTNHRYDLIGEGSGPCEKSRGSECRAGQRGAVVSGRLKLLGVLRWQWANRSTKTLGFVVGLILRGWNTIPSYVEGTFHTVSHEKRILFTNRWSVVFGCDTHQGFDSMEDFVETLTTRAKGGSILFRRMECFPKDFSKDIQKWS